MLFDRDTKTCFDKDITEYLDKYHNKCINRNKAKLIDKHENKHIDKCTSRSTFLNPYLRCSPRTTLTPSSRCPDTTSTFIPRCPPTAAHCSHVILTQLPCSPMPPSCSSHVAPTQPEGCCNAALTQSPHGSVASAMTQQYRPQAALTPPSRRPRHAACRSHTSLTPAERLPTFTVFTQPAHHLHTAATSRRPHAAARLG